MKNVGDDDEDIESVDREENVNNIWPVGDDDQYIESVNGQENVGDQCSLDKEDDEERVLFQRSDINNDDMGLYL